MIKNVLIILFVFFVLLHRPTLCCTPALSFSNKASSFVGAVMHDFWFRFYHEPKDAIVDGVNLFKNKLTISNKNIYTFTKACVGPLVYLPLRRFIHFFKKFLDGRFIARHIDEITVPADQKVADMARQLQLIDSNIRLRNSDYWACNYFPFMKYNLIVQNDHEVSKISEEEKTFILGHELGHIKNKHQDYFLDTLNPLAIHAGCSLVGALLEHCLNLLAKRSQNSSRYWLQRITKGVHTVTSSLFLRLALRFVFNPSRYSEKSADKCSVTTFNCTNGAMNYAAKQMIWCEVAKQRVLQILPLANILKNAKARSWKTNAYLAWRFIRGKYDDLTNYVFDCHPAWEKRIYYVTDRPQFSCFKSAVNKKTQDAIAMSYLGTTCADLEKFINTPIDFACR